MTTRDKVLAIRAEQPHAHAAQIAQTIGVTTGRVYQLLHESGSGWSQDRHTPRRMGRSGGTSPT